ncbi:MAG: response regulator transcription factor [Eubacteriaceae bacterium]|nr:response regulator transcription factor [Eubacteriaceae bacterium]
MNVKRHILLIEDDEKISNFMSVALSARDYAVRTAKTGKDGIWQLMHNPPDIVILDLGLPDIDGNEVIKQIRSLSQVPILIVSAREMESDKILALDSGANDYVTKPFALGELLARIRVMERYIAKDILKSEKQEGGFVFGDLFIDTERRRIFLSENEIHLTPLEYKLLVFLAENCGKVVTHSQIGKHVWGYENMADVKTMRACMANLRRKIEKDPSKPKYIFTEIGVGYRFTDKFR